MKCDLCDEEVKNITTINHVNVCPDCLEALGRVKSKVIKNMELI